MVKPTGAGAADTAGPPPAVKRGRGRPPVVKISDDQYESSRKELLDRKKEIQTRLNELNVKTTNNSSSKSNVAAAALNDEDGAKPSSTQDIKTDAADTSISILLSNLPPS